MDRDSQSGHLETEEESEIRLVEVAHQDARPGRIVSFKAVKAWADSLGTPHKLPPPKARRSGS